MPLIALVDGVRTVSLDLSPADWDDLSARRKSSASTVLLIGCEQPGFLRRSKSGLQHFVHRAAGDCTSHEPETPEHRAAKSAAYRAVHDAGWDADVEVSSPAGATSEWIADVMATRGNARVAIEIQWSRQDHAEFERRQARYAHDGVRAVWFARHTDHLPTAANQALPVFSLTKTDDDQFHTAIGPHPLPLADAVVALLTRAVQFREHLTARQQPRRIVNLYPYGCYRCGRECVIWHDTGEQFVSRCGTRVEEYPGFSLWGEDRPEADAATIRHVRDTVRAHPSMPAPATLSKRYSRTADETYMAFSCPHCSALFGDWHVRRDLMAMAYDDPALVVTVPIQTFSKDQTHWCFDQGSGHC